MSSRLQRGATTVEFAFIGAAVMLVLFGVIEVGRAMFVVNALGESTRRAARMAAVCPINDPAIVEVAMFAYPDGGTASTIVGGLTADNVLLEYLAQNGAVIADPVTNFGQIHFVRTRIVGFQHQMLIPFVPQLINTPGFATTLRRESLGVPREGTVQPC
jgi:Flp pilus assembly protein TadG